MNFLAWLVIILILIGLALHFLPVEATMKKIIYTVIVVVLIVLGLRYVGLWPAGFP